MSNRPLVPRDWKTTNAIADARKPLLMVRPTVLGKQIPVFNGSQNNRKAKKRPITLPERA